ncbi:MAG: P-loop NTPase [Bacteriovoracaceae bacterium]|nr:P-loop NTPase [Bacteriovoracaceae bacterium]
MSFGTERREAPRFETSDLLFEYQDYKLDVLNISKNGVLIYSPDGLPEDLLLLAKSQQFVFWLHDKVKGESMECEGRVIRCILKEDNHSFDKAAIAFNPTQSVQMQKESYGPHVIAVGGSKGGVGKTVTAVNLSLMLALLGKKVTLFDADFGDADCHTMLGVRKLSSDVGDYLHNEVRLADARIDTSYKNLKLISGGVNKIEGIAKQVPHLWKDMKTLPCDYVVVDLDAGIGDHTIEFYNRAATKIIVLTPQFTSLQNAYSFIKASTYSALYQNFKIREKLGDMGDDFTKLFPAMKLLSKDDEISKEFHSVLEQQGFKIIGNMVNSEKELGFVKILTKLVGEHLGIESSILDVLRRCNEVHDSINKITPFIALSPESENARRMKEIVNRLIRQ